MAGKKAVSLLSGGLDSTVLAYDLKNQGYELFLLSVNYGQRHKRELEFAKITAGKLRAEHRVVDLSGLNVLLAGSALTTPGVEVPEGHYAEDNMAVTVVPNRNMILLSIAVGWAVSVGAELVAFAAHAGDHTQYPDCRDEFVEDMQYAARSGNLGFIPSTFALLAPYVYFSKAEIGRKGVGLGVPFEDTWSCYKGGELHCGRCGTCCERLEALHQAGAHDLTRYEDDKFWVKAVEEYNAKR